jgi:hypothetical protein
VVNAGLPIGEPGQPDTSTRKENVVTTVRARERFRRLRRNYEGGASRPLGGYLAALTAFGAYVGLLTGVGAASGARLPKRVSLGDVALVSLATHKLSRLFAKDAITSPIRAPFTRYEEPAGAGELNESVRGGGVRHALGELASCPFCLAVWSATTFTAGLVIAPRATRLVTTTLSATAVSDALQFVYDAAKHLPSRAETTEEQEK